MTTMQYAKRCLALAGFAALITTTPAGADVFSNVPEAADYTLLYQLDIPTSASYRGTTTIPYAVNNAAGIRFGYDRVAYYFELVAGATTNWVYASMDDFSRGAIRTLGLPHSVFNPVKYQMIVRNMNIVAKSGNGIVTGTGLATGNIEFWPSNYGGQNDIGIPGASGSTFDFGDGGATTGAGYGSFQVHNYGAGQTVFAYNHWGAGGTSDVGIGNRGSGAPDWTFANNAGSYSARTLQIFVRELPDDSTLTATVRSRVPEVADFELLCDLPIPAGAQQYNSKWIPYSFDRTAGVFPSLARVAYYLELDSEWVYVSMDAFSPIPRLLGVPSSGPNGNGGSVIQGYLDNMNVLASGGAGVTTGTGIGTGNIEFWYSNYGGNNAFGIPGASSSAFDFGDQQNSSGGYGSMQVHNYGAAQTIFAYNRWGSAGDDADLGIGNQGSGHPDWTLASNADGYTTKHLQIFAQSRDLSTLVPEAGDYRVLYKLAIPNLGIFRDNNPVPYSIDNSQVPIARGYDRVAYCMELNDGTEWKWVWVSMDDFVNQWMPYLSLPHNQDNPIVLQQYIANMNVYASANAGVTTGTGIQTGNIEMWCGNYNGSNAKSVPNADGGVFDFGDGGATSASAGHGSFQVHNYDIDGAGPGTAGETLFAYNRWGGGNTGGNSELGIGNQPSGNPDWTLSQNGGSYTVKNLWIFVRPRPDNVNTSLAANVKRLIPESRNYELVYDLDLPVGAAFNSNPIPYNLDRSRAIPPSLGRIAYYLELDSDWVYVSMDAFTQDPTLTGVPSRGPNGGGTPFQQYLTDMNVFSTVGGVKAGTGIQTGNIEFWPDSYSGTKDPVLSPPNATGSYDFGDTRSVGGDHGSMQIHNYDIDGAGPGTVGQTIFAYNNWGNNAGGPSALGIGDSPTSNHDWTFNNNTDTYTTRHLQVLVLPRVYANVPQAESYAIAYGLSIPGGAHPYLHARGVPYGIDWSADLAGKKFGRVAYYIELKKPGGELQWVFVSFESFTEDIAKVGVPAGDNGRVWQQSVGDMDVYASANLAGTITTGTGLSTGNIEFWPNDYSTGNSAAVPGANAGTYDFGDDPNETVPLGYGSMQVHNHGAAQTIFAYNGWGMATSASDLGIGNQASGQPDWTFSANADDYEVKNLFVLVEVPMPATTLSIQ